MRHTLAVIMGGGAGTRLFPLTQDRAKPAVPLAGKYRLVDILFRTTDTEDVLVVQINPVLRASTPQTSQEIVNRINEITFNASLIAEYRAIAFVRRLIDEGALQHGTGPGEYRRINVHRVDLGFVGKKLTPQSGLNTDFDFFETLHRAGRRAGRRFLDKHFDDIGVRSTIDLHEEMRAERGEELPAGVDRLAR